MVERRTKALLVEDDPNIVDLVRSNLTVRGYDTCLSPDGSRALQLLETERPDIVLLDLMFPDADGFELCRQMRERSAVGIIVVSARGGQHDKVAALNYGADDYLTKPFGIEELMARITATLRRTRPAEAVEASGLRIEVGDVVVDLEMSLVTKAGDRGKLLTHAQLLRRVWGPGYATETEYVRVYIRRLRAKLESNGGPPIIITQPRAGYRFAPD